MVRTWLTKNNHRNRARIVLGIAIVLTIVVIVSVPSYLFLNAQVGAIRHCLDFTPVTCTRTPAEQGGDQNLANWPFGGMLFGTLLGIAAWLSLLIRKLQLRHLR